MKEIILLPTDKRFKRRPNTLKHFEISDSKINNNIREILNNKEIILYEKHDIMNHYWYIGKPITKQEVINAGVKKEGNWIGVFAGAVYSITKEAYHNFKEQGYQTFKLIAGKDKIDFLEYLNQKEEE